jgi:carboxyl-terminal processing protease
MRLTIARYYTPSGRFIQKSYEDKEAYKNDYMRRFMNGEMTNLDSIKLPDSLKFETLITKRPVYGGGGIMPDVFVPLDTTELTDFYRDLSGTGIFNSFALTYVDKNRDDLNKKYESSEQFKKDFMVSDKFIKEMIDEAMKDNKDLKMDDKQYQVSKELIRIRMKATIANDLFGGEAFYLIYNEKNEILQKAISILEKNDYYNYNLERK